MLNRQKIIEEIITNFQAIRRKMMAESLCLSNKSRMRDKYRITYSQRELFNIIIQHDGIKMMEISKLLGISNSATTQLVDGLVNSGYLIRESDSEDRRALKIKLSNKSKKNIREIRIQGFKKISGIFEVLNDDELSKFSEFNKKIADKILNSKNKE